MSNALTAVRVRRRRWIRLAARVVRLMLQPRVPTAQLVSRSYDRVAAGYDEAWTDHMRHLSLQMLDRLAPPAGGVGLDLTCGTGFVTRELAGRTGGAVAGVDASEQMLDVARAAPSTENCRCSFVHADALVHLRSCPTASLDVITCAWGLGYTRPFAVLREAARVLRPGGRIGIIDNTLFSLSGVLWTAILTFAEAPQALNHVVNFRFLPGPAMLRCLMRLAGFSVLESWGGEKTFHVPNGRSAIARLTATGAAAGFEFAAEEAQRDAIFTRFAEIMDSRARDGGGVAITHRYLAATGQRR